MSKIKTAIKLLKTPEKMLIPLARFGLFNWMDDTTYLKMIYRCHTGCKLDLSEPLTFSEKIQWLKLHDRNERYIDLVDKIKVKDIVANIIGREYIIPTIGTWNTFDEINFDTLPNQFVLKCNHDSGSVVICTDKASFDIKAAKSILSHRLKKNAYYIGREWPYKYVKKKILAEQYLSDTGRELIDYKFYCFNGIPRFCQVITNRHTNETIDFFDMNWEHQPFVGLTQSANNSNDQICKPLNYEKMINFSKKLGANTIFSRIDFYEVKGQLFFGEITFYPTSGFGCFRPAMWNTVMGNLIKIK